MLYTIRNEHVILVKHSMKKTSVNKIKGNMRSIPVKKKLVLKGLKCAQGTNAVLWLSTGLFWFWGGFFFFW